MFEILTKCPDFTAYLPEYFSRLWGVFVPPPKKKLGDAPLSPVSYAYECLLPLPILICNINQTFLVHTYRLLDDMTSTIETAFVAAGSIS